MAERAQREPDNWFRKLQNDRLEISLRAAAECGQVVKVRASGPESAMYDLVEWFEEKTGKRVEGPGWKRPLRTGPKPHKDQLAIDELPSDVRVAANA